jgi:hypothetical protein
VKYSPLRALSPAQDILKAQGLTPGAMGQIDSTCTAPPRACIAPDGTGSAVRGSSSRLMVFVPSNSKWKSTSPASKSAAAASHSASSAEAAPS